MSASPRPILYSFRRCPYAMRARLALHAADCAVEHREILLRDKPPQMLAVSPKGTVPVLVLPNGPVLEESLDIMLWALEGHDPEGWLDQRDTALGLVQRCDQEFKPELDRYKYSTRYEDADPALHRAAASRFLIELDRMLTASPTLSDTTPGLADHAIFPFVRQFALTDRDWFDQQDWPALRTWLDRQLASPRFADIMRKHPLWTPAPSDR